MVPRHKIESLRKLNRELVTTIDRYADLSDKVSSLIIKKFRTMADPSDGFEILSLATALHENSLKLHSTLHDIRSTWVLNTPSIDPEHISQAEDDAYFSGNVVVVTDGDDDEAMDEDIPDAMRGLLD